MAQALADAPPYMANQLWGPILTSQAPSAAERKKQAEMFFGPGIFQGTQGSSADIAYVNYNPSHFGGTGLYLATTISGLVGLNNDWAVMALPIVKTNAKRVTFNTVHFNIGIAGEVPYEGIPRMLTSSTDQATATTNRLGIAFQMETTLLGTPEGMAQYEMNVAGIVQTCNYTVALHTILALLRSKNYLEEMQKMRASDRALTVQRILANEAERFATLVKSDRTFDLMVNEAEAAISRRGATPTMLLVPPAFPLTLQSAMETGFWVPGANGQPQFIRGADMNGMYAGRFAVYTVNDYTTSQTNVATQPLKSHVSVGEWYGMFLQRISLCTTVPFCTEHRDIFIYSSDADTFVRIPFVRMLEVSRFWQGSDRDQRAGTLSQTIYNLADHYNSRLNEYPIDFNYYSNPQLVEQKASLGTKEGGRTLNMMLRVDARNDRIEVVKRLGDFDLDVITSAQIELVAQTVVDNLLHGAVPAGGQRHQDFVKLIDEMEKVGYNEAYFTALVQENLARSVGPNRQFVGTVVGSGATKTVQMTGNQHGGLDLPQYNAAYGEWPAGMANFPGLLTYQAQAQSKGWLGAQGQGQQGQQGGNANRQGPNKLDRVNAAIEYVSALSETLSRLAYGIDNFDRSAIPEWFGDTTDLRVAVFAHLHNNRPPLFVRLPQGTNVSAEAATRSPVSGGSDGQSAFGVDGVTPIENQPRPATATDFLGALPKVKYVTTAIRAANPQFDASPIEAYFRNLSDVSGAEQFKAAEQARQVLSTAMYDAALSLLDSATTVKAALSAFGVKLVGAMSELPQENKADAATALAGTVRSLASDAHGEAGAAYIAARSGQKKDIENEGNALLDRLSLAAYLTQQAGGQQGQGQAQRQGQGQGQAQRPGAVPPPPPLPAQASFLPRQLLQQLNAAVGPEPGATPLTNLHTAVEAVGTVMRQYLGPGEHEVTHDNLKAVSEAIKSLPGKRSETEKSRVKGIVNSFSSAKKAVADLLEQHAPVQHSAASIQSSFMAAGAQIEPLQNQVFVRAPITATKKLLGDIAREQQPAARPADPATGWRTPLMVWGRGVGSQQQQGGQQQGRQQQQQGRQQQQQQGRRGQGGVASSNAELLSLLNSPIMAMPSGSVWPPQSKEYSYTATFNSKLSHPNVMHAELGLDTYVVPSHIERGYVDDIDTEFDYAGDDYTIDEQGRMVSGIEAIQARQRMINRARVQRGLDPRDVYSEFAHQSVASQQRHMQEVHAEQQMRAQQMYSGAQMEPIGQESVDPLSSTLQYFTGGGAGISARARPIDRLSAVDRVSVPASAMASQTFEYRWAKAQKIADPLKRLAALFVLSLPNELDVWKQLAAQNVLIPFNIAVFRPYIEFQMYSAILLAGGFDTGVNIIGEEKQLSDVSAADGMFLSAYTFHHVSLLRRPENVAHLRNVLPAGVIGGWGTEPFVNSQQLSLSGEARPDLFAVVLPATTSWLPPRFNMLPMQTPLAALIDKENSKHVFDNSAAGPGLTGTHSSARFFQEHWNINESTIGFDPCNFTFFNQGRMIDSVLSQGTWIEFSPGMQAWGNVVEGSSALSGQLSRPRVRSFMDGASSGLARYEGLLQFQ